MATKRQDIVTAIVTRMGTITTPTYQTAVVAVDEWRTDFNAIQAAEIPLIAIYDTQEEWAPAAFGQNRHDHRLTVTIQGISTTAAGARNLLKDIHQAINTDRTWGGLAEQTEPKTDQIQVAEAERKYFSALVTIEILYQTTSYGT